MLKRPDERTKAALRHLSLDSDFHEVIAWLQISLAEMDQAKRITSDGVLLRQQQGAAQAIAELVAYAEGRNEKAIAAVPTAGLARPGG